MSTFSVVATPIGNLEDITLRALKVLAAADLILCEDTRTSRILLNKHGIKVPTLSYHTHSKVSRTEAVIALLRQGKNLALISDAGTPGISDPGAELVAQIREKCAAEIALAKDGVDSANVKDSPGIRIEVVPGPSALTAALSIAGVPCADFTFLGFLPHKKGRETLFKEIAAAERTMVFYESPHRIERTLESLVKHLAGAKRVTVCRELTKVFEEIVSGTATAVATYFRLHQDAVRGEFAVIVS